MHIIRGRAGAKANGRLWRRRLLLGSVGLVVLFVAANAVLWFVYRNRVLPRTTVGTVQVGNVSYAQLDNALQKGSILPVKITLQKGESKREVAPITLGFSPDTSATAKDLAAHRSWLPLAALLRRHTAPVRVKLDSKVYDSAIAAQSAVFRQDAQAERIGLQTATFVVVPAQKGFELDTAMLKTTLLTALAKGQKQIEVPTSQTEPPASAANLAQKLPGLQKQLDTVVHFSFAGQTVTPTAEEKAQWFVTQSETMTLNQEKIGQYITLAAKGRGFTPANSDALSLATTYAMSKNVTLTFVVAPSSVQVYHYCVKARGVSTSELPALEAKLAATYNDPRGWNGGGKRAFAEVASNCDYTVWLSAPSSMTSFGGVCDDYYSCRSGPNVVINFDRWKGATDPWNAAGGSLEDYRVMVINHESGHWLGFGHGMCPSPGQPAPVMQQQSIDLQGCTFNPWPTANELSRV